MLRASARWLWAVAQHAFKDANKQREIVLTGSRGTTCIMRRHLKWSSSGRAEDAERELDITLTQVRFLVRTTSRITLREEQTGEEVEIVLDRGSYKDIESILSCLSHA